MSQNNQLSNVPLNQEDETSFLDNLLFLKQSWKTLAVFGALGSAIAVIYFFITPRQYQAIAQIHMAQISTATKSLNPLGINIEEPTC